MNITELQTLLFFMSSVCLVSCNGAKILGIGWYPATSHQATFGPIWRDLSLRGHQVTVISTVPLRDRELTNLTEIDVSFLFEIIIKSDIPKNFSKNNWAWANAMFFKHLCIDLVESILKSKEVMTLIQSNEHFDVIIAEAHTPLVFAFGEKFKAPIIAMSSATVSLEVHDVFGNPTHPLISPDSFISVDTAPRNTPFLTRSKILLMEILLRMIHHWSVMPRAENIARKYFGKNIPPLETIYQKYSSLLLTNVNMVTYPIRANVPSVIEIDQIHIKKHHSLPKDLQDYLDSSTNGFVYFSLGTHVPSSGLNNRTLNEILLALSELPYNVLWKWEKDTLPGQPSNVIIRKFFPQQDILAHRHIKVFITQGGLQSIEEAICNAVPMVGIPFIADQPINVGRLVDIGVALQINSLEISKESLKKSVLEVAENQRYKNTLNKYRAILQDQPLKGVDKAIWWIEYVIRYKGAQHLRSPAADMYFFEYLMLDVIIFLIIVVFIIIYSSNKALIFLYRIRKLKED